MPSDAGDEVGAPALCPHHAQVVANLDHLDDTDHHDTANAREEFARQCPSCRRKR